MDPFTRRVYLARVRDFVEGTPFPATRVQILANAERKNTPSDIIHDLNRVRLERFDSLDEVVGAIDTLRFGAASR